MRKKKIAVAVIPGVGKRDQREYEKEAILPLQEQLSRHVQGDVVIELINWTHILEERQNKLRSRFDESDRDVDFGKLRHFFVSLITDIIVYQPDGEESSVYQKIHKVMAQGLQKLSQSAGEDAPLVIVSHSLGAVIASNYMRELQNASAQNNKVTTHTSQSPSTPLEKGETFAQFYTFGTFLPLYSVRHETFTDPVQVPSPQFQKRIQDDNVSLTTSPWINFYDRDDIFSLPLGFINDAYQQMVDDREVSVGGWLKSWNPLSHLEYWGDQSVLDPIVEGITALYDVELP